MLYRVITITFVLNLLIGAILAPVLASAASASNPNVGVYALGSVDYTTGSIDPTLLANSNVDGYVATIPWSALEPTDGGYNWSAISTMISQLPSNQFLALYVTAGGNAPSWLVSQIQTIPYVWDASFGGIAPCTVVNLPVPWDVTYMAKADAFITALGLQFGNNPKISRVAMTMVTNKGLDVALPTGANQPIDVNGVVACYGNDYNAELAAVGYSATLVETTYEHFFQTYQTAFPTTALVGFFTPTDFPNVLTGKIDASVHQTLVPWSSASNGNFIAMNEALSSTFIWSFLTTEHTLGVEIAFQMVGVLSTLLPTAVNKGIGADANYMEIYGIDVKDPTLKKTIAHVHNFP